VFNRAACAFRPVEADQKYSYCVALGFYRFRKGVYLLLNLAQKKELVTDLNRKFGDKKILILVDYKGLNVPKMADLRARLREVNVELIVVKNTLLSRAAEGTTSSWSGIIWKGRMP